jgi:hypothetical protein
MLPIKGRLCHEQLRVRCGDRRRCGVNFGPLLDRIDSRQDIAGIYMSADIDPPFDDAPADSKREIGTETRLDFTSQRQRILPILRMNDRGAHESCTCDRGGRLIAAGAQRQCRQRESQRGAKPPDDRTAYISAGINARRKSVFHGRSRDGDKELCN